MTHQQLRAARIHQELMDSSKLRLGDEGVMLAVAQYLAKLEERLEVLEEAKDD